MTAARTTKRAAIEAHAIPDAALDDRLAFVGTSGSGKTYTAGGALERLLATGARAVIVDPLGVWWGLRLNADGKTASPFDVVIFGGPHGDLPLTENAGALIGETAASMAESVILDLSEIGTAAGERRFVAAFLRALYTAMKAQRVGGEAELLHLVLDEADMWAPQTIREKDGGAATLFAITERIVRRGRIDGFIPWQITQRPAELSKSVLSQAEGLIAMMFTAKQDKDALDGWIGSHGDVEVGKRIKASLPTLQIGEGVVWIPRQHILIERAAFPKKLTFDSSRAPKRGEKRADVKLKPLDLDALKGRLAQVEAEAKANDPSKLKAEVARLQRELAAAQKHPAAAPDKRALEAARREGFDEATRTAETINAEEIEKAFTAGADAILKSLSEGMTNARAKLALPVTQPRAIAAQKRNVTPPPAANRNVATRIQPNATGPKSAPDGVTPYQLELLGALAFWNEVGITCPSRAMVAAAAAKSSSSSTFEKYLSQLRAWGYIDFPSQGTVTLTHEGAAIAPAPTPGLSVRQQLDRVLTPYQATLLDSLPFDGSSITREELASAAGVSTTSSTFEKYLSQLKSFGFVTFPTRGEVAIETWVNQ